VEVQAPENIQFPLLQTRIKTRNGNKTITPKGKWIGIFFSEEIYNALKYDYSFKIIRVIYLKRLLSFQSMLTSYMI